MGTPGHLGDFNLQKLFTPSTLSPYTSPSASYSAGFQQQASASHPLPFNTYPAGNNFPSTYPFNPQQSSQPGMQTPGMQGPGMYNPYIHGYPSDHGHRPPPYPSNPYSNAPSFPPQAPPPGTFTQPPFLSSASPSPPFMQPPSSAPPSSGPQLQANAQSSAPPTSGASLVQAPDPVSSPPLDGAHLMALLTTQSSAETSKEDSSSLLIGTPNLLDLPSSVISSDASQNNGPEVSLPPPAIAPALPSAPPMNLAPPNSRLPGTKPPPRGRYLNGDHIVYDIDERLPYEAQPQLEVSPITVYGSDPVLVLGRQIAVNRTYIGYGLKQGTIRILNINTALRVLLRGHTQRVTDMVFFSEDVHLLASASTDGRIFVRRVLEGSSDDARVAIKDQILLAIQIVGDWKSVHPRVCWHSENQDVLLVGIGKYVLSIDIAKARVNAPPGGFSSVEDPPIKCPVSRPLEGVLVLGEHSNDVTDLSVTLRTPIGVASASLDGTVRIWGDKGAPLATLYPHQGQAVNSVSFISAPSRPDQAVLVTAGPLNREVKLFAQFPLEGPPGKPGSGKWKCIQILELKSSKSDGRQDSAFFNQVMVVPSSSLVILANAKKNAIYVVHLEFGLIASATQMDYLAEFSVTMPILSLTATGEGASDADGTVQVYCVQTQAIQQYALELSQCLPTADDLSHARSFIESQITSKADEQVFFPVDSDYPTSINDLTSVSTTASIVTTSTVVNPTGPSRGSTLGLQSERASTYEQNVVSSKTAVSLESTATIHTSESDVLESIDALSSLGSLTRYGEAPSAPPHNVRPVSPAQVPSFLNNKRQQQGESPTNSVEDGYVLVPTGSGVAPEQPESTAVQEQPALEAVVAELGGLSTDQTSSRGADFDKEEEPLLGAHSTASDATTNTQQQPSGAASYLLSPTELMNMVARSKVSEVGATASPSLSSAEADSIKAQAATEVATSGPEPDILRAEILGTDTEAPQSSPLVEKDEAGFDEKTSLLLDVKDKVLVTTGLDYPSKEFSWDGNSSGTNFVEGSPADDILRAEDGDALDDRELLPSSTADDIVEQVKEVGSRTGEATSVSAAPTQSATVTKGRKNKNKTSVSPAAASLPLQAPSQIPLSTGTSTFEGEGSSSANLPLVDVGVVSQLVTLQDSVNQLVAMQKELQKQLTITVASPIAKEVKRVETSLGSRMEKVLKAHQEAMWARIQEEVVKGEKQERERTQQLTTLIGNSTKDIPATLERVLKKEVGNLGPVIARLVTPSVEKISTTAITDAFQKGLVEKIIPQLEKTVASKLETVVTRQVQAHLQQSLKPALQDAVQTAVEATLIPGVERSCQAMFQQVDGALQRGIAEHTLSAHQQFEASHSALAASLQETIVTASSLTTQLKGELSEGQRRLIALAENANATTRTNLTSVKQSNSGLPDKAMSLQRLEESLDPTIELSRLVNERNLEEAFTKALSISDVAIVSWLCTQVDLKSLFSTTPLPLSQGVLLSMIQQLGSDLGRDISLKLEWIKETALALNPKDPLLAPHMRPFLEQLYQNLHRQSHHLATGGELANSMRLVIHLVNSLLTACK